jgi:hypothetical protein
VATVNGERLVGAARGAFAWIDAVEVEAGGGRTWQEDGKLADDLYSGTAGVLLGCAEATAGPTGSASRCAGRG